MSYKVHYKCSLFLKKGGLRMDIEEYQSKDIAGKILYLASMFKGIKDHLDVLNEREGFNQVESQIFTILNDLELGIHELCILYEILEKE